VRPPGSCYLIATRLLHRGVRHIRKGGRLQGNVDSVNIHCRLRLRESVNLTRPSRFGTDHMSPCGLVNTAVAFALFRATERVEQINTLNTS
jgi:hypothetical protein